MFSLVPKIGKTKGIPPRIALLPSRMAFLLYSLIAQRWTGCVRFESFSHLTKSRSVPSTSQLVTVAPTPKNNVRAKQKKSYFCRLYRKARLQLWSRTGGTDEQLCLVLGQASEIKEKREKRAGKSPKSAWVSLCNAKARCQTDKLSESSVLHDPHQQLIARKIYKTFLCLSTFFMFMHRGEERKNWYIIKRLYTLLLWVFRKSKNVVQHGCFERCKRHRLLSRVTTETFAWVDL